ncbi:hypothetical protein ACFX13_034763 [Malus domestica]
MRQFLHSPSPSPAASPQPQPHVSSRCTHPLAAASTTIAFSLILFLLVCFRKITRKRTAPESDSKPPTGTPTPSSAKRLTHSLRHADTAKTAPGPCSLVQSHTPAKTLPSSSWTPGRSSVSVSSKMSSRAIHRSLS